MRVVKAFMSVSSSRDERVTFREGRDYYQRLWPHLKRYVFRRGVEQMIGALLSIAILAYQLYFGLIPAAQTKQAWASILLPYVILVLALLFISGLRAPVALDRERINEIEAQTRVVNQIREDNSRLVEIAYPKVSPEEERRRNIVAGKMKGLTEQSKKVLRYIMDHGRVKYITLDVEFNLPTSPPVVQDWLASGLLVSIGGMVSVKEEFRSSVDHLLTSDGF